MKIEFFTSPTCLRCAIAKATLQKYLDLASSYKIPMEVCYTDITLEIEAAEKLKKDGVRQLPAFEVDGELMQSIESVQSRIERRIAESIQ